MRPRMMGSDDTLIKIDFWKVVWMSAYRGLPIAHRHKDGKRMVAYNIVPNVHAYKYNSRPRSIRIISTDS